MDVVTDQGDVVRADWPDRIARYKGMSVGGGPAGVGRAVSETVFAFIVLFVINIVVTAVGIPFMVS